MDDRGWIPGYLEVAPDGRQHIVSCAPHWLIVAEWLVSDARLSDEQIIGVLKEHEAGAKVDI